MKYLLAGAASLAVSTSAAVGGGLDWSGQPIGIIFEKGNYAELSFGYVDPDLTGTDVLGNPISNVGGDSTIFGAGAKFDIDDRFSFAVIADEPYGADIFYTEPATTMLGGTGADASSLSFTGLLRYKFNERFSVYGGPRYLKAEGRVSLSGLSYGPFTGYLTEFAPASDWGYVVGAAYEIPEIAFRVALTYSSAIELEFDTTETFGASPAPGVPGGVPIPSGITESEVPASINIDFQTGIAKDTLLFAAIRHSDWEDDFDLTPPLLGRNVAELDDGTSYTIGLGRRFNEKWAGSISFIYEDSGDDRLVSPLSPKNGSRAISLGARYKVNDSVTLSGAVRYTKFQDSNPETGTPDVARATFTDNDAISFGFKLGYHF